MNKKFTKKTIALLAGALWLTCGHAQLVVQNFSYTGQVASFTVPALCGGQMTIEAKGAGGGSVNVSCTANGGLGAGMKGVFSFTPGTVLRIMVGQVGQSNGSDAGGGGGSFVALAQGSVPVIVAGGGGGASNNVGSCGSNLNGTNASTTTSGSASANGLTPGGTGGNGGGATNGSGSAGGGFNTDGQNGSGNPNGGGKSFLNGGAGGTGFNNNNGGYGGGGCGWHTGGNGGGGGGYSGGSTYGASAYSGGGGGGSFNSGTNQVNTVGANSGNGLVTISYEIGTPINVVVSNDSICEGQSVNMSASGSGLLSYTWSTGSNNTNISVSPLVSTLYTVAATNGSNCVSVAQIPVTVHPLPMMGGNVTPTLLCVGSSATLSATGAPSYTWDNGPQNSDHVVSPTSTTIYSLTGTSQYGCVNGGTVEVLVNSNVLTISPNTSICVGSTATIQVNGGVTYTWSSGQPFNVLNVTPSVTTTYIANSTDANGCVLSNSVVVTVHPKPGVGLTTTKTQFCVGDKIVLTATGADSYAFSNNVGGSAGGTGTTIPTVDVPHTYTVVGTNAAGCTNTAAVTVSVIRCVGLAESNLVKASIFPNPSTGIFAIELSGDVSAGRLQVYNVEGKLLLDMEATNHAQVDLRDFPAGIYPLYLSSGEAKAELTKLIRE
jgi:hypothetical protein